MNGRSAEEPQEPTASVVVLTPNPAVDVTYRVARQTIGTTQRVLDVARRPGGKGINVVRVLRALDVDALSVAPLGGSAGTWISSELARLGVPSRAVPVGGETRTTVTVVDDARHPTMFGEPGPVVAPAEWHRVDRTLAEALAGARLLVVAGSLPTGTDPAVVGRWVSLASAAGIASVADVSGPALLAAADAGASVVKPNAAELLEATGATVESRAAAELLERGAGLVVVSRGADGIRSYARSGRTAVPAVHGITGNPTGAGDAATAGLVAATLAGRSPEDVLRFAAAAGAAAVLQPVAGEIDPHDVTRFLRATNPSGETA